MERIYNKKILKLKKRIFEFNIEVAGFEPATPCSQSRMPLVQNYIY